MQDELGIHAGIIMDGNGRWAKARGLPRVAGHEAGADAVRRTVESAPDAGVTTLTLYAFSSDNWKRPPAEVAAIMQLFRVYLASESERCVREGVRLNVIGRRDRLATDLVDAISVVEHDTRFGDRLHLRLAVDYSSRDMLLEAARRCASAQVWSRESFSQALGESDHGGSPAPDVDLLIRTSGEQRLSDFLLWECAYAEFVFLDTMWPDFNGDHLRAAVDRFQSRQRRFGAVPSDTPVNAVSQLPAAASAIYSQTV